MTRIMTIVLTVASSLGSWGCVTAGRAPLEPEIQAKLGRVGVKSTAKFSCSEPVGGWAAGLGYGILRGVLFIPAAAFAGVAGGASGGGLGALAGGAAGAALAAAWLPFSIIGGAVTAEQPEALALAKLTLPGALKEAAQTTAIRDQVVRSGSVNHRLTPIHDLSQAARLDSLLEMDISVELRECGFFSSLWTVNPEMKLAVFVRTRLMRLKDGRVLDQRSFEAVEPEAHTYVGWARSNGAGFRLAVSRLMSEVAYQVARDLFMSPPPNAKVPPTPAPPHRSTSARQR